MTSQARVRRRRFGIRAGTWWRMKEYGSRREAQAETFEEQRVWSDPYGAAMGAIVAKLTPARRCRSNNR